MKHKKASLAQVSSISLSWGYDKIPFFLLCFRPRFPIILEIISAIFDRWCAYELAVASADEVDKETVEEMRHVMLLSTCSAFAKTFHKQDSLKNPEFGSSCKSRVCKYLRTQNIVYADLSGLAKMLFLLSHYLFTAS